MIQALIDYNRDMNRVFGTCVRIQGTARHLGDSNLEIELLARNGVAEAARLPEGKGRSLLVLAEVLSELPDQIRPDVDNIETLCERLARNTADCSNVVRLYYQLVSSLLVTVDELGEPTDGTTRRAKEALRAQSYLRGEDIGSLKSFLEAKDTFATRSRSSTMLSDRCRENLGRIGERLSESENILCEVFDRIRSILTFGRTARYLAQNIAIEAAAIGPDGANFTNLSRTIHDVVDQLEKNLSALRQSADKGEGLLESLRRRVAA